jgi:adenylate cyclase
VFTDTADFTRRVERDGILHFLMLLERALPGARRAVTRSGGRIVKVEADSLLLDFSNPTTACRGVLAVERHLKAVNRGKPPRERLRFSYGVGYGEVLALEDDLFGLEVNLASKLGEDLARPGEALLTPSAVDGLDLSLRRRLAPHGTAVFARQSLAVSRLRLPR